MIREGKMTAAGMAMIEEAKKSGWWEKAYSSKDKPQIPDDIYNVLKSDTKAWEKFNQLTNSEQTRFIFWVNNVKRQETREKRIREMIEKLN